MTVSGTSTMLQVLDPLSLAVALHEMGDSTLPKV